MIGKIVRIKDGLIYVQLAINVYSMPNLIGKNVTFDNRYIGEIISMSSTELEINLVGQIVNGMFLAGSAVMPKFGSECRFTSKEEIDFIYGISSTADVIKIGKSYVYENYPVYLNVGTFFSNHFAILGNSGSGKSCTVASIIQKLFTSNNAPVKSNILFFDAFGEYTKAFSIIGICLASSTSSNKHKSSTDKNQKGIIIFSKLLSFKSVVNTL